MTDTDEELGVLPIYEHREGIVRMVQEHQVSIVAGETGSGKSTMCPQFVLERAEQTGEKIKMVVTQPRRLAARSLSEFVSSMRNEPLGTTVGYRVSMDKSPGNPSVTYMTTGLFIQILVHKGVEYLRTLTHVFIDEVHERDMDTDLCMVLLRKFIREEKDDKLAHFRLVLMSATINAIQFSDYFGDAPILTVETRQFDVRSIYLSELVGSKNSLLPSSVWNRCGGSHAWKDPNFPLRDGQKLRTVEDHARHKIYLKKEIFEGGAILIRELERYDREEDIHDPSEGAVLCFLPGMAEISEFWEALISILGEHMQERFVVFPAHSTLTDEDQRLIFEKAPLGMRKIVLSTNIAESSLTVPDVRYVIDFGLEKVMWTDQQKNLETLRLMYCTKASATQRSGRAGRVTNGLCFRMYGSTFFESSMLPYPVPALLRCPLENLVLRILVLDVAAPQELLMEAMEPPSVRNIEAALDRLVVHGALNLNEQVTTMGSILAFMPCDVATGRLVLMSFVFGALEEGALMSAAISLPEVYTMPFMKSMDQFYAFDALRQKTEFFAPKLIRSMYNGSNSDVLCTLSLHHIWKSLMYHGERKKAKSFLGSEHVSVRRLRDVDALSRELAHRTLEGANQMMPPCARSMEAKEKWAFLRDARRGVRASVKAAMSERLGNFFPDTRVYTIMLKLLACICFAPHFSSAKVSRVPPPKETDAEVVKKQEKEYQPDFANATAGVKFLVQYRFDLKRSIQCQFEGPVRVTNQMITSALSCCGVIERVVIEQRTKVMIQFQDEWGPILVLRMSDIKKKIPVCLSDRTDGDAPLGKLSNIVYPYSLDFQRMFGKVMPQMHSSNCFPFDTSEMSDRRYLLSPYYRGMGNGDNVLASSTIMLPNDPPFVAELMMVMSSPVCVFLTNIAKTRISGVVLGRGENALRVHFPYRFDKDDWVLVNRFRALCSVSLMELGLLRLRTIRNELYQTIMALLARQRPVAPKGPRRVCEVRSDTSELTESLDTYMTGVMGEEDPLFDMNTWRDIDEWILMPLQYPLESDALGDAGYTSSESEESSSEDDLFGLEDDYYDSDSDDYYDTDEMDFYDSDLEEMFETIVSLRLQIAPVDERSAAQKHVFPFPVIQVVMGEPTDIIVAMLYVSTVDANRESTTWKRMTESHPLSMIYGLNQKVSLARLDNLCKLGLVQRPSRTSYQLTPFGIAMVESEMLFRKTTKLSNLLYLKGSHAPKYKWLAARHLKSSSLAEQLCVAIFMAGKGKPVTLDGAQAYLRKLKVPVLPTSKSVKSQVSKKSVAALVKKSHGKLCLTPVGLFRAQTVLEKTVRG